MEGREIQSHMGEKRNAERKRERARQGCVAGQGPPSLSRRKRGKRKKENSANEVKGELKQFSLRGGGMP